MRKLRAILLGAAGLLVVVPAAFWLAAWSRESRTAEELAPREGHFLDTNEGRVFIEEAGPADGDVVLLVHGMGAWSGLWRDTLSHLAGRGMRGVAIDLPPFGFSDRDQAQDYSRQRQAERILAIVDALHAKRIFIAAHSIGAAPVVEALMHRKDAVAGVVLIDPALGIASEPAASPSTLGKALNGVFATPFLRDPIVASTLTNPLMTRALFARLVARQDAIDPGVVAILQRPMRRQGSTDAFAVWLKEVLDPAPGASSTAAASSAQVTTPVHLIWGDRDTITPLDQARQAHDLFKGSSLAILPGLGHVPQVEDPAAFRAALDAGLAKLGAAAR